ncbi:hypothetical protein GGR08_001385 [Bartonella fuyuanensis]|uniref:Phage tail collar domain-containing protein n=1 Tax=Bartonella fuyuanensis TaxID=1460968 RepID=A0A840E4M4_9HYPH|nr:tail fiber protein [Bartonella fuyuanensis]MBB4077068.1 hypothetical protein [Bartonella fuyuanensis]
MSTVYDWSLTASKNAYSDSLIDWSEGQRPSSVNNSARVMMQRVREYLSDTSGVLEGNVTVNNDQTTLIRLESASQFLAYKNGISFCFKATGKNVGATMIALNNLAAQPVYKATETGLSALSGGEIQQGCIYTLVYRDEDWQVLNPTPVSLLQRPVIPVCPPGTIVAFGMQVLPKGWLLCDGKAYLRSEYRALYDAIGTRWGSSENYSKFNVPDLRGVFLRGVDNGGGYSDRRIDYLRYLGTLQNDSMRKHDHSGAKFTFLNNDGHTDNWYGNVTVFWGYEFNEQQRLKLAEYLKVSAKDIRLNHKMTFPISYIHMRDVALESSSDSETRPINMSVVFGIKT